MNRLDARLHRFNMCVCMHMAKWFREQCHRYYNYCFVVFVRCINVKSFSFSHLQRELCGVEWTETHSVRHCSIWVYLNKQHITSNEHEGSLQSVYFCLNEPKERNQRKKQQQIDKSNRKLIWRVFWQLSDFILKLTARAGWWHLLFLFATITTIMIVI